MKEKLPEEVKQTDVDYQGRWYGSTEVAETLNQLIRFLKEFLSEEESCNCNKGL